jgi:hypothetical protein
MEQIRNAAPALDFTGDLTRPGRELERETRIAWMAALIVGIPRECVRVAPSSAGDYIVTFAERVTPLEVDAFKAMRALLSSVDGDLPRAADTLDSLRDMVLPTEAK